MPSFASICEEAKAFCCYKTPTYVDEPYKSTDKDLDVWEKKLQVPKHYDPPQLTNWNLLKPFTCLNFHALTGVVGHRSPMCIEPVVPCCCGKLVECCWLRPVIGAEVAYISEPDELFKKMLAGGSPHCPPELRGVFWMRDNLTTEVLLTFQDGNWVNENWSRKYARYNWTGDLGTCFGHCIMGKSHYHTLERAAGGKWWSVGPQSWIYTVQPEDKFTTKDGQEVPFVAGEEHMRIDFSSSEASTEDQIYFQYRMQRVAYLDENGQVVKTPFYEELKRRALMTDRHTYCCNYLMNVKTDEDLKEHFSVISNRQAIVYPPKQLVGMEPLPSKVAPAAKPADPQTQL